MYDRLVLRALAILDHRPEMMLYTAQAIAAPSSRNIEETMASEVRLKKCPRKLPRNLKPLRK